MDPEVGEHGTLELCSCVTGHCRCSGPPYWAFDEQSKAQPCFCLPYRHRLHAVNAYLQAAEIPPRYRFCFRQAFQDRAPDGTPISRASRVRRYVERVAAAQGPPGRGLFLYGPPGTGKTLLASIILNELVLHHVRPARFVSLSRGFFHRLRDTFSEESERHGQAYQMMEALVKIPYLAIDDLGVQRGTEWEEEVLYDLVDGRYAEERFTIVTTNVPLEQIKAISAGRIYSRLCEMCHLIEIDGPDWRTGQSTVHPGARDESIRV